MCFGGCEYVYDVCLCECKVCIQLPDYIIRDIGGGELISCLGIDLPSRQTSTTRADTHKQKTANPDTWQQKNRVNRLHSTHILILVTPNAVGLWPEEANKVQSRDKEGTPQRLTFCSCLLPLPTRESIAGKCGSVCCAVCLSTEEYRVLTDSCLSLQSILYLSHIPTTGSITRWQAVSGRNTLARVSICRRILSYRASLSVCERKRSPNRKNTKRTSSQAITTIRYTNNACQYGLLSKKAWQMEMGWQRWTRRRSIRLSASVAQDGVGREVLVLVVSVSCLIRHTSVCLSVCLSLSVCLFHHMCVRRQHTDNTNKLILAILFVFIPRYLLFTIIFTPSHFLFLFLSILPWVDRSGLIYNLQWRKLGVRHGGWWRSL